jgi:hypothetical protein
VFFRPYVSDLWLPTEKEFSPSSFADMMCQVNLTMKNRSTETGTIVDADLHKQQEKMSY